MKKFKKTISLLVVMVMAMSLIPQTVLGATYTAAFESYFQGWGSWSAASLDNVNTFYCVTDEIAHSGNHSVVIKHADSSQNWSAVIIAQDGLSYGAGDYTFSFWAAGNYAMELCGMTTNGDHWDDFYLTDFTAAETEGDWIKYTVDFTVPEGKTQNAITLMSNGNTQGLFLDDISLVAKGTTNNLLKNGSFDFNKVAEYSAELEPYFYGWGNWSAATLDNVNKFYCVTDEIAHSGNHSVVIKHTDGSQNWKAVMIAQDVIYGPGDYTLSFWAAGTYANNLCGMTRNGSEWDDYYITDFAVAETDGDWTKYSVDFTISGENNAITLMSNGDTQCLYVDDISLVAKGTTENLLTNASFEKTEAEEPEEPEVPTYTEAYAEYRYGWGQWNYATPDGTVTFACVTDEIAHDGSKSIVLRHANTTGDNLMVVQEGFSAPAGTYTVSFWAVGTGNKQFVNLQGEEWLNRRMESCTAVETDGIWSKYELSFTVPEGKTNNTLVFGAEAGTEGWYIDDISLVKQGTTENLLTNASFENTEAEPEVPTGPVYTTEFADYFYGWGDWSAVERDGNLVFLCVTDEDAHSGNHSFVLKHVDSSKTSNICLAQNVPSLAAGEYTISFWSKGVANNGLQGVTLADPWRKYPMEQFTVTATDGDWKKYELAVTADGGETALTFMTDGQTEGWYLDDISLVKVGTTNNLLTNPGFEEDGIPDYTTEFAEFFTNWEKETAIAENGSTIFTCVTNDIAHSGNYSVILRSLDKGDKDLMIKQTGLGLGEGTYRFSFWATGTVADLDDDTYRYQQIVWLDGLDPSYRYVTDMTTSETDGDWRKYVLEFTVPAGSTVNAIKLSTRGHGTEGLYVDDFSLEAMGDNTNLLKNGSFEIDGVPEYTTEFEDYFTGWQDWSAEAKDGNLTFLCVTNELAHSGNNSFVIRHVDGSKPSNLCLAQNVPTLEAGQYTISFWSQGVANNGLQAVTLADPWKRYPLEDFTVTETDGDWKKYELTVTADGGETALTFPTDGGTEAWFIDDISLVKVGTTNNLVSNGSFELKSLNGYYVSTPKVVKIEGENRRELTALESGNLEISLEVANYSMGDNFAPILIVALYNGGALESMEFVQQGTSESALDGFLEDEISFTVEVPEMTAATAYQLKVMCWDNWSTLTPLVDSLELE